MNKKDDLAIRQLLFTPYRMETGVPMGALPVYAASTPPVPPFLLNRKIGRFAMDPPIGQQEILLKSYVKGRG
ncbi:hypothetical protein [Bacillus sp. FJAT-27245]|uniref:hypothetical protein n=1 Tax=Bacillus sp. FJAT-27245 TaxID=1684144 RepID=UPI0006A772EE|nr:hypothetical protein [Bacillus sp. FJAT-27245]